ncbi:MAG: HAD hydrolase-like protein [Deferribacteres bacterium]|nr:HAD hydrolase-like protein [Deferribacteres bacterium]
MNKLILFDIDGTLISTGGAGSRALDRAFLELFGIRDAFRNISMAGKTDPEIMREGLTAHGFSHVDGNLEKMKDMYLHFLRQEIENPLRHLKPGIRDALTIFNREGIPLGLLTGNLRQGAQIKLSPFGLYEFFLDGAFGSDDEDRDRLLPIAIDKFAKKGFEFSPQDCIIVGDTPRDVRCAKVHGANCIAVATGPYSKEHLLDTEADIVLESFEEREKYMDFIMRR